MQRFATALIMFWLVGCATGGNLPVRDITIDDKHLSYKLAQISDRSYLLEIWAAGIVVLPDRLYETSMQMRGAEVVMKQTCGKASRARVVGVDPPAGRRASTRVTFLCEPLPEKRKKRAVPLVM